MSQKIKGVKELYTLLFSKRSTSVQGSTPKQSIEKILKINNAKQRTEVTVS